MSADIERIDDFNQRYAGAALIDTIEVKAERTDEVERAMKIIPENIMPYFEIPLGGARDLISTLALVGGRAKVRAGGHPASMFR